MRNLIFVSCENCVNPLVVKMNGKMHSETGAFSSDGMRAEILNPFVHKLELDNTYDKIKVRSSFVVHIVLRNMKEK